MKAAYMASGLVKTAGQWARAGFPLASEETLAARLDACRACEFWDARGFRGSGRCRKCGCSTQAKLRMATAKCPVGKW
jgi:hypothetical protein